MKKKSRVCVDEEREPTGVGDRVDGDDVWLLHERATLPEIQLCS